MGRGSCARSEGQGESARNFYSGLFGWRFGPETEGGYRVISSGGELIGGLSHVGGTAPDVPESQWVAVLSVEDVAASSKVVKSSGGKVISGPLQTSEGNFALVRDNSRAALSLYDGKQGFPLGEPAKANSSRLKANAGREWPPMVATAIPV